MECSVSFLVDLKNRAKFFFSRTYLFVLCGLWILFVPLVSCSDSEPRLVSASGYVIFDYADNESFPTQRFAVFLEASSDVRRVSSISVTSRENSYQWNCREPTVFSSDSRMWAGYSFFVSPVGSSVPRGVYDVRYVDSREKFYDSVLRLDYRTDIMTCKACDIEKLLDDYKKEIAVYDGNNVLVYFGEIDSSWKTPKKIFSTFRNSASYRKCIVDSSSNSICILPPVYKDASKNSGCVSASGG